MDCVGETPGYSSDWESAREILIALERESIVRDLKQNDKQAVRSAKQMLREERRRS